MRLLVTVLASICIAGCSREPAADVAAAPDLAGIWLPDASRAAHWPEPLPLTEAARAFIASFDPDRQDPTGFCMPYGTPRNTLAADTPLEVLQKSDRVYFVFQPRLLNAETRRVYLDGRPLPAEDLPPTWLGTSRGHWEGATLVVETVAIEPQAILSSDGLPHSAQLKLTERWTVTEDAGGRVLRNDMTLEDPEYYSAPLKTQRYFVSAPQARMQEGQCSERLWIDNLWRHRLAEHAQAAKRVAK